MNTFLYTSIAIYLSVSCSQVTPENNVTQPAAVAQKDTCDEPDANINCCFNSMPANPGGVMTIDTEHEPGDKLVISGTIYKADGTTLWKCNCICLPYQHQRLLRQSRK